MAFLKGFLRVYSWIFETILSLMALAAGTVALVAGIHGFVLGWLPWTGRVLLTWLTFLGLAGLFFVFLSLVRLRFPLFLFSLSAAVLLARGFFFGSYAFAGPDQARNAAILVAGAMLAVIGSLMGRPDPRRRR